MTLERIRKFACSLPEVTEAPHFHRTAFRVRGKIIVTAVPEEQFVHVFVSDAVREPALAMYGDWAEKLMWGKKAVGLRIDLRTAEAHVVEELITRAWEEKAPKSLLRDFRGGTQ